MPQFPSLKQKLFLSFNLLSLLVFGLTSLVTRGATSFLDLEGDVIEYSEPLNGTEPEPYQLVLDNNNKINYSTKQVLTSSSNTVGVDYNLPKTITGFLGINNNGWFKNTTPISGMKQIYIHKGAGNLLLSYGYSSSTYATVDVVISATGTITLPHDPTYLKIANTSGSTVNVYTLTITYSCDFIDQTVGTSGLAFTLEGNTYRVSKGSVPTNTTSLVIPLVYANRYVTVISSSTFSNYTSMTSLTLPGTITEIKEMAFYNCTSLSNITFPDDATITFQRLAFGNTPWLTAARLERADRLVIINDVILEGTTTTETNLTIPSSIVQISDHAFSYNSSIQSVTIPSSVTMIGSYAFDNCSNLTTVTNGSVITRLNHGTFRSCSDLTTVNIPATVTSIGVDVFRSCVSLTSITIPRSVTSIENTAFSQCSGGLTIIIPIEVATMGQSIFFGSTGATVFCEPPFRPAGWDLGWNNGTFTWGWYSATSSAGKWYYDGATPTFW